MSSQPVIALDGNGFYSGSQNFIPVIAKSFETYIEGLHNTIVIPVDVGLQADLNFDHLKETLLSYTNKNVKILFDLRFGFFQYRVKLHQESFSNRFCKSPSRVFTRCL